MTTLQKIIRSLNEHYSDVDIYDTKVSQSDSECFEIRILRSTSTPTHNNAHFVDALVSLIYKSNSRSAPDVFNNLMYELPDVIGDYTDEITFNVVDNELHCTFKIHESVVTVPTTFVEDVQIKIGG